MKFASDNWTGAAPEIMQALAAANDGSAPAYGGDELSERVKKKFSEVFEARLHGVFRRHRRRGKRVGACRS